MPKLHLIKVSNSNINKKLFDGTVCYTIKHRGMSGMKIARNWSGCGTEGSWYNSRYFFGICLEKLRKLTIGFSQSMFVLGLQITRQKC